MTTSPWHSRRDMWLGSVARGRADAGGSCRRPRRCASARPAPRPSRLCRPTSAQAVGIFKKHGLDLKISAFGGDAKVQQAMAADGIDIGLGSGPGMAFIVKGSPVKGVAAMADQPLIFALVVRNDGSVKTADDLKGRKVGVSGVGSVTNWIITEISRQQGWGVEGIPRVGLGNDANRVAALKTKSVDAAIVNIAVATQVCAQSASGKILLRFDDLVKDFHIHVIYATDKAIAAKPEAIRGFLAGWFETIKFMRANKAKTGRDRRAR